MLVRVGPATAVLLLALGARAPATIPQGPVSLGATTYADSCLPASEFQLGALALGAAESKALTALGNWLRVTTSSGEDDGGRYELRTYYSRDLEMDIVRGVVDRVATHSPRTATPSGVRPGLSRAALARLLATKGVPFRQTGDPLAIPPCQSTDSEGVLFEALLELAFDHAGHVRAISMAAGRP
jgi:hypothetical protein